MELFLASSHCFEDGDRLGAGGSPKAPLPFGESCGARSCPHLNPRCPALCSRTGGLGRGVVLSDTWRFCL